MLSPNTSSAKYQPWTRYFILLFAVVGIASLVGGFFTFRSRQAFIASSEQGSGKVVDIELKQQLERKSASQTASRREEYIVRNFYHPVIEFTAKDGTAVRFTSDTGANPPSYQRGEIVPIRYALANPYDATVDDFLSLWLGTLVLVILGVLFTVVGVVGFWLAQRDPHPARSLETTGMRVQANLVRVERIGGEMAGSFTTPYIIIAERVDPATKQTYTYFSEPINQDPQPFLGHKTVTVLIDPNDPSEGIIDTSFMPVQSELSSRP